MTRYFKEFFAKPPEKIIEWSDSESSAQGWLVVNSLRGNAAGGGTRMKSGCTKQEVINLAKTMEIKFAISGPSIGGAKSGIDYDPQSEKEKQDVLRRWFRFIKNELTTEYGTGGDYNVDQRKDVIPLLAELGIKHPQEGIVRGHLSHLSRVLQDKIIQQLYIGITLPVPDPFLSRYGYCVADVATGYGLVQTLISHYTARGDTIQKKRIIIEGFGNVGGAAAYFAAQAGAVVVGILEKNWYLTDTSGINIKGLFSKIKDNKLSDVHPLSRMVDDLPDADIFIPAATSGTLTAAVMGTLERIGIQLIACGANNPFDTVETLSRADARCTVIPDFIANAGMARTFAYLMDPECVMTADAIFKDITKSVDNAVTEICGITPGKGKFFLGAEQLVTERLKQDGNVMSAIV